MAIFAAVFELFFNHRVRNEYRAILLGIGCFCLLIGFSFSTLEPILKFLIFVLITAIILWFWLIHYIVILIKRMCNR